MKKLLGCDPEKKNTQSGGEDDPGLAEGMKIVLPALEEEEGGTHHGLERVDPKFWRGDPNGSVSLPEKTGRPEKEKEDGHRQEMGEQTSG